VSASVAKPSPDATAGLRNPLERLLHGLNQPLTGLQCSLEVALAAPRTVEYYQQRLREGVDLAERMRALVVAIREVAEEESETELGSTTDGDAVLREVVEGLQLVAEAKKVRLRIESSAAFPLTVHMSRQKTTSLLFRMIESVLSLAAGESEVRIQARGLKPGATKAAPAEAWIGMRWRGDPGPEFSPPELGLLVAQAGWERAGAKWERERLENTESVTVWLAGKPPGKFETS
jgi:hypothetical protein